MPRRHFGLRTLGYLRRCRGTVALVLAALTGPDPDL